MKNSELKCNIEVEGIILTKDAIDTIKYLQEHNNESLDAKIAYIKDVICWIVSIQDALHEEEAAESMELMGSLNYLRKDLYKLRKP